MGPGVLQRFGARGRRGFATQIPQPVFRDRDLNRRLDYDVLNRVNRYFERVFDLADQSLSYREVEAIAVNAQADVFAILTYYHMSATTYGSLASCRGFLATLP